ncbi:unnamed protein product [Rotaria sp. Silwood2]|nr:unnamed protein product [Rotaria sp. Silwood2]
MFFDRESTVVITKFNNLSESVLTSYCKKFGSVIRCLIKTSTQSRNKDLYALIKFAKASSVTSILNHRNHTINGAHIVMRSYHQDTSNSDPTQALPSLMSLAQQNPITSNHNNNNDPQQTKYDQIMQENYALKCQIGNLQTLLFEAHVYSETAYNTFQMLREKFDEEQDLANKLKSENAAMVESHEALLKQLSSSSVSPSIKIIVKDKIKEEPIDSNSQVKHSVNNSLEMRIIKEHLEQAQIDLGRCQAENALLNAKLIVREQQFDIRFKELNNQYIRIKKQYEHLSLCIKDFHAKVYPNQQLKPESKEENNNKTNDSNEDVVEITMQVEPILSQI